MWHFPLTDPFQNVGDGGGIPINDLGFPDINSQVAPNDTTGCFTYVGSPGGGLEVTGGSNPNLYQNPCWGGFNPVNQAKGTGGGIPIGALPHPALAGSPAPVPPGSFQGAANLVPTGSGSGSTALIIVAIAVLAILTLD